MVNSAIVSYISRVNDSVFLKVFMGVVMLSIMAQISIPLEPVPVTLHTVGVMLIGLTYDKKSAVYSILSYLAIGGVGAPIFQDFASGLSALTGTTSGYLFGFIVAAYVMSGLKSYFKESFKRDVILCSLGTAIIFVFGISVLSYMIGVRDAFIYGFIPFIIPGALKILMLSGILGVYRKAIK